MPLLQTQGAASARGYGENLKTGPAVYIEDVFSTWLYDGNGGTQTITNSIDLSTKGGLVWIKKTNTVTDHAMYDTARGATFDIASNLTGGQTTQATGLTAFGNTGFTIGSLAKINTSIGIAYTPNYVSWTFRKQPKFFDIVTYTGNGANRTIAHNLGTVPGCIFVKRTDTTANWQVYHNGLTSAANSIQLNLTTAQASATTVWDSTAPTSAVFSVGTSTDVNASGGTYVAYIFAHDAGGFGNGGADNVISCGSFVTDGSGNATVNLGYEPQWVLIRRIDSVADWRILDTMRPWSETSTTALRPNSTGADLSLSNGNTKPKANGFTTSGDFGVSSTCIYIAIRRGPMKAPTVGTSVFLTNRIADSSPYGGSLDNTDLTISKWTYYNTSSLDYTIGGNYLVDRLRGGSKVIATDLTDSEGTGGTSSSGSIGNYVTSFYRRQGFTLAAPAGGFDMFTWSFRRAPGFFDVVCYTGDGTNGQTVNHNLGVVPEMIIIKNRSVLADWSVGYIENTSFKQGILNSVAAMDINYFYVSSNLFTAKPTASVFRLGAQQATGQTYVAYLFATVAGVSKVGSYTGNGSSQTINCNFTTGARFILIKRTDSTGDWYVWDSARGIVASNDPHISLNTSAAEVTTDDSVDTDSTGFIVNQLAATNINVTSATYIFLAIA
jgi:hypothetical protein